jgi:nitroreductase
MAAPSASNAQPWHFVVVSDRRQLDALAAVLTNGQMLRQAPLAIVVCGEPARSDYWVQDCSAATENILLAAHALGLGGVWLGVYPRADRVTAVSEVADLPAHIIPLCVLSLGFPAEEKAPADRYNEARVHRERW